MQLKLTILFIKQKFDHRIIHDQSEDRFSTNRRLILSDEMCSGW